MARTAAAGAATSTSASSAAKTAEKGLEKVGETSHVPHIWHASTTKAGLAELVITGPRLRIAQHLIGLADLLEFFLGRRILVDIRVVLACQPPIGPFEGVRIGISANAQQLVIIRHQPACSADPRSAPVRGAPPGPGPMDTFTKAWRSTRPFR